MASLRAEAQDVLHEAREGIAWIACWKEGRSWCCMTLWPEVERDNTLTFEDEEKEQMSNIIAIDPFAILVNSWYHNLGDCTCMTRDTLAEALRWQYGLQHYLVRDALDCGTRL